VEAWLSPLVPKSSIIWVNAVPGAGETLTQNKNLNR